MDHNEMMQYEALNRQYERKIKYLNYLEGQRMGAEQQLAELQTKMQDIRDGKRAVTKPLRKRSAHTPKKRSRK